MTTSDASAKILPYDRGPVKVLTVSTGSLKSLPFDHGPASPNLSVLLQAVQRLVFEVMTYKSSQFSFKECVLALVIYVLVKTLS